MRPGFSLPEIVVVLFVVSMLAYVAVPTMEVVRFRMDGAARGGVAALLAAQRLAVKRQHDVVVAFDTANRQLRIHQDRDNDGVVDDEEPVRTVVFEDGIVFGGGGAPAMGADAAPITFTETQDGHPALRFIRNGSASEEGAFYLTSSRSGNGSEFAEDSRLVRVERATGRLSWYRYGADAWHEGL